MKALKYEVIKEFICKNTSDLYRIGNFYETDDANRADELISKGFLREQKRPARKKAVDK